MQPTLGTLQSIYESNPGAFNQAQQWLGMGMQQQEQALQKAKLANMFDEQNNPLRLQQQRLENETSQAKLPGILAESQGKARTEREAVELTPERMSVARAKFLESASESDITRLEAEARKLAMSSDPALRKQGEMLLGQTKGMLEEKMKHNNRLAQIREQGAQMRQTNQERPQAANRSGLTTPDGKLNFEKAAVFYTQKAMEAAAQGDQEQAMAYKIMADQFTQKANELRAAAQAAGQAGKIDAGAVSNLPTRPAPQVAPMQIPGLGEPSRPSPMPQMNVQKLQQMYPGVPVDKLKEAYKKKFGVDIN